MSDLWIEVDLDAVRHNYRQILSELSAGCTLMAVVKADAYGLGAVEVAKMLQEEGCDAFAVTTLSEAFLLREGGISGTILALGPSSPDLWKQAIEEGIELTVSQLSWIPVLDEIASQTRMQAKIHLKLETGMGRTGFTPEQLTELAEVLHTASNIEIVGAYSHFARGAQRDHNYTRTQNEKYLESVDQLAVLGITIPTKHICNSAAFLDFPEYHYDMVRIGTLLGGHFPSPAFDGKLELRDPWLAKARIIHIQKVMKGTYVGYQSIYKSRVDTTLAVVAAGYADGFGVEPKLVPQGLVDLGKIIIKNAAALFGIQLGREKFLLKGKTVSVAGKIGMQLTVLDVGTVGCQLGDEIILPIRRALANPRIPRYYKKDGGFFEKRILEEGFFPLNTEYSNSIISAELK